MSETNINAYKEELERKKAELGRLEGDLAELKSFVEAHDPDFKPEPTAEVGRSAKSGQFVSDEEVEANPDETVTEKVKKGKK